MIVLECRSCFDRWLPRVDERHADPEITVEFTFCAWCGQHEHDGIVEEMKDEKEDYELLWGEPEEK